MYFGLYVKPLEECDIGTVVQNVRAALKGLCQIIVVHKIQSFSVPKLNNMEENAWRSFTERLTHLFRNISATITICTRSAEKPALCKRYALISEAHSSVLGGHKGITKTYHRLRNDYYY